jgi:hypothetical protein
MDTLHLSRTPALSVADFPPFFARAPWWGADLQTLRNFLIGRTPPVVAFPSERIELPMCDGSGDRLVATLNRPLDAASPARPLIVLIHGLSGDQDSFYVLKSATHLLKRGFSVLRLNLRGAGLSRSLCRLQYHAGRTEDFADALAGLPRELTANGVVAVGYSLGGNMLLKYLGERGRAVALKGAVTVSAPLDLASTARRLMRWRNVIYQTYLLRSMRQESLGHGAEISPSERKTILNARSIWDFDHGFSAPRNGFRGAEDYYERNASRHYLDGVAVPALVIHALDDPWIPAASHLNFQWRRNRNLFPLLSPRGGHVGFQGNDRRAPWHDLCIARFVGAL